MARWRLQTAHYLNVVAPWGEQQKWVREETHQETGRLIRKEFLVPTLLSPDDPSCHNRNGECTISRAEGAVAGDWLYEGPPTADMEPLDAEAQAISDAERPKWLNPIETLPANGEAYGEGLIRHFETLISQIGRTQPAAQSLSGVTREEFEGLKAQMAALMERNAQLEAQLTEPELDLEAAAVRR